MGTTFQGGTNLTGGNSGVVFKLTKAHADYQVVHAFGGDVLGGENPVAEVGLFGKPGGRNQLLRSTDLTKWNEVTNLTMPSTGQATVLDPGSPSPAAWYRACSQP